MGDNWGYIYPSGEELLARSLAALWMSLDAAEDEDKDTPILLSQQVTT